MESKELSPCPFCAGEDIRLMYDPQHLLARAQCYGCGASVYEHGFKKSATADVIDKWNRRTFVSKAPYFLRALNAYWEDQIGDIEALDRDQMISLIKELDRRFIQLWDKVIFERENNLVDYSKCKTNT